MARTASESTRIDLSPFSLTDASGLFLIRGDEEAMRHWDWPADKTLDDTRRAAEQMLRDVEKGTARYWTVRPMLVPWNVFPLPRAVKRGE